MYDGGRRGLPMYDLRRTMYDLDYSACCAEGCMDSAHALPRQGRTGRGGAGESILGAGALAREFDEERLPL